MCGSFDKLFILSNYNVVLKMSGCCELKLVFAHIYSVSSSKICWGVPVFHRFLSDNLTWFQFASK